MTSEVCVTTRGGPHPIASKTVHRRAERMISTLKLGDVELSVALVDDAVIRELNRSFRDKDRPTDVLSFPMSDADLRKGLPKGLRGPLLLGDVIISIPTALRQAKRHRRSLRDEVTMLLAHGLAHLLGYDHETDEQHKEMEQRCRILEAAANRTG